MTAYLLALVGLVALFGGGELLVRGAVTVARHLGLSSLLIGLTVVAAATSAPELFVSASAALKGSSAIALGNVVGSNIVNILGVLGLSALITPIAVAPAEVRRDTLLMLGSVTALALAGRGETIGRTMGAAFLIALIAYFVYAYRSEVTRRPASALLHEREAEEFAVAARPWLGVVQLCVGLGALIIGSRFLVDGATGIARSFGVPEAIIGLTLVAAGTSLPELATSIVAAARGHSDVAVGNVVGSNLFNALGIIGATALIKPIEVAPRIASTDVWLMVGASVAVTPLLLRGGRIGRLAGAAFLIAYVLYVALLFQPTVS